VSEQSERYPGIRSINVSGAAKGRSEQQARRRSARLKCGFWKNLFFETTHKRVLFFYFHFITLRSLALLPGFFQGRKSSKGLDLFVLDF
jgi:hypothetical protein